jgi:glycosyltransferase involved in cell wall biosynthesis
MLDEWSLAQKPWKKRAYSFLVENNTVNKAGALWFSSEEERLSSKGFHYSSPSFVIPLGVTLTEYEQLPQEGAFRNEFLGSTKDRLLLFLGRITPVKQLDLLVRAFAEIAKEFSDVRLVIAGPDEDGLRAKIAGLTQELGVANKVNFPGGLEKEQVVAALCDADVFVLPSLHENFGVAAIEAMAAGTPVIVTETVGLARFVHDAEAGVVVGSDVNSLVSAIRDLLNNPSVAKAMGQRGRSMALDKFTWGNLIPEITTAYENVIRHNQNGAVRKAVS